jgi:hypothetical protein
MEDASIIEHYKATHYYVDGIDEPIMIGRISPKIDALLQSHSLTQWAYITAYNPMSRPYTNHENEERNRVLRSFLDEYLVIEGRGIGVNGDWPPEDSFFIGGITLDAAIALAKEFEQRAIVYGVLNQEAQLIITMPE